MSSTKSLDQPAERHLCRRSRIDDTRDAVARLTTILAVIYAIPHIWWGFEVDWLAPGDMRREQALGSSPSLTFAFHGMGALALFSAVLTWGMNRPIPFRIPTWFLALHQHGWGIGILLLIRGGIGLTESSLVLAGARDCPFPGCGVSEPGRGSIGMTGMFREPLFVIWGAVLLTTVALRSGVRHPDR